MLDAIARMENKAPLSTHLLQTVPDLDMKSLRVIQRKYWNAFKHLSDRTDGLRNDDETLAQFTDEANDAALFVGWSDYQEVTGTLPIEAQVFHLWWFAMYPLKLAPGTDMDAIRQVFPEIEKLSRSEQKRRLRRVVEKYRRDPRLLSDPATDYRPLSPRA
ncbi:hypothetical protein [Tardiphaga sp. 862_B3_N1_1]|uniref:hypothetical protein n=1 Tax=Tardiphaga sp. 862_B3_N1_1 TaxID=3240763 RepID=UPI003F88B008